MNLALLLIFISITQLLKTISTEAATTKVTDIIYVYAYSWTPGFCKESTTYPGCISPQPYWKSNFTIHGLWPQYTTTGYPSYCSTTPFDPNTPLEIGWDTMTQYYPDVKYSETDPDYDSFWEHEWDKHGTCSGLNQTAYFQQALDLAKNFPTPSALQQAIGQTIDPTTLQTALGGPKKVALQCTTQSSITFLTGAYTCWTATTTPTQIDCPTQVQQEDTCNTHTTILIPSL